MTNMKKIHQKGFLQQIFNVPLMQKLWPVGCKNEEQMYVWTKRQKLYTHTYLKCWGIILWLTDYSTLNGMDMAYNLNLK